MWNIIQINNRLLHSKEIGIYLKQQNDSSEIGLLVEPNFFNYKELLGKNRRATSINACYAMTPLPTMVNFVNAKAVSGIQGNNLMYISDVCFKSYFLMAPCSSF